MSKSLAIMQPYIFPYIGYFQLINSVDEFVIYDNIQYTKKGWINRNRILMNGKDTLITVPLKKDSDFLNIVNREISQDWVKERVKRLNQIKSSYKKSPYFDESFSLIEKCLMNPNSNLFDFIYDSICNLNEYFGIKTKVIKSSELQINHDLKSKDKVIEICKCLNSDIYINAIGGVDLYDKEDFKNNGIQLNFIKSNPIKYKQFENEFVPWLSIIDVMMFNSKEEISNYIKNYTLV